MRETLTRLVKNHVISWGCYINHKAEEDETKDHKHLYVIPSRMTQTDELKELFRELDPENISKPLGVMPWMSSKFDDWYLYSIHDAQYLASKFQKREYQYARSEMWSTDDDFLDEQIKSIRMVRVNTITRIMELQKSGWTWTQYFASGAVPIQQFKQYSEAWQAVYDFLHTPGVARNGHPGHDDTLQVDKTTGEIIETANKAENGGCEQ